MFDIATIISSDYLPWSILLTVLTAAIYLFGKIQASVKPGRESNFMVYFNGLSFILYIICVPLLAVNTIDGLAHFPSNIGLWFTSLLFLIQLILIPLVSAKITGLILSELGFEKLFIKRTNAELVKCLPKILLSYCSQNTVHQLFFQKLRPRTIFFVSFISLLLTWLIIFNQPHFFLKALMFLVEFWILIALAMLYASYHVTYEPVTVIINGKTIRGDLIKDEGDRLIIRQNKKNLRINFQKVDYFSQSYLKKGAKLD
jgi:hypothetical protein